MKRPKAEGKMSPKILLEKNKERENRKSEEKERNRRKKKNNGCTLSFYVPSAKDLFMGPGTTILDREKWNSKPPSPPPPKIKDEAAQKPKRAIFPILDSGGGKKFSIYFVQAGALVQDCSLFQTLRHLSDTKEPK